MVSFTWSPFNVPELCAGLLTLTGQGASGQPPCSWAPTPPAWWHPGHLRSPVAAENSDPQLLVFKLSFIEESVTWS